MGSAADPDVANPPAIAVPEALPLPGAAAIIVIRDVGRPAVIAVTRSIITVAGAVAVRRGQRAADDGAADDAGRQTNAQAALGMGGGRRCDGRNREGGDGSECHQ